MKNTKKIGLWLVTIIAILAMTGIMAGCQKGGTLEVTNGTSLPQAIVVSTIDGPVFASLDPAYVPGQTKKYTFDSDETVIVTCPVLDSSGNTTNFHKEVLIALGNSEKVTVK